jgi:hypothetical protein
MAVEIRLTFGKDGLKITQLIDPDVSMPDQETFREAKRLRSSFTAGQTGGAQQNPGSTGRGSRLGGAIPHNPFGPGGAPDFAASGTVTLIGPIVITTCDCLQHEQKRKEEAENG